MTTHRCLLIALLVTLSAPLAADGGAIVEDPWIPLFDGESLEGWIPKFTGQELGVNYRDTFRVEDGLLKVCYDEWDEFGGAYGHLFYKQPFSHYILRVEYRFVGDQTPGGAGWAMLGRCRSKPHRGTRRRRRSRRRPRAAGARRRPAALLLE